MLRKILVPVDNSRLSEAALWKAAALARTNGATVRVALVYQPPFPAFDGGHVLDADLLASDRAQYMKRLHDLAGEVRRRFGCHCEVAMLAGDPATAIVRHADEQDADLIVMSTHGRTGVNRAWFGSVADATARHSPVPVILVRACGNEAASPSDADPAFRRVLIALDGSEAAEGVLRTLEQSRILEQAAARAVEVVLPVPLPLVGFPEAGLVASMTPDVDATAQLEKAAAAYLNGIACRLSLTGARRPDTKTWVSASAGPAIVAAAQDWNADLVAITSHGRGATRLVMGSVADKVLRGTTASVLLVRTPV